MAVFAERREINETKTCDIATRMGNARNKPLSDRIIDDNEDKRNGVGAFLKRRIAGVLTARITSGVRPTSSLAKLRVRSMSPSPQRPRTGCCGLPSSLVHAW